jgi:hypothetical protein
MFEYIKNTYNVPAEIGREVLFNDQKKGIIISDLGNYIGVNFYDSKPQNVLPLHPTWNIKYLDTFGKIRKPTKSQERYQRYLKSDSGLSFMNWLKYNN